MLFLYHSDTANPPLHSRLVDVDEASGHVEPLEPVSDGRFSLVWDDGVDREEVGG
jgi:hypothetical protein